jgi:hypothetical protein
MIGKSGSVFSASAAALALAVVGLLGSSASHAASINYGNSPLIPPGVSFLNVTESSGTDAVPLYGPPTYFITGMGFTPTPSFKAEAHNGAVDLTDGQLNYSVQTVGGIGITNVGLGEGGLYSLLTVGTAATQVTAGASLRVNVTQINGVNVAPILVPLSNASVAYNLAANPGVNQPWNLGVSVNVAAVLGANQRATRIDVIIDNQLTAISQVETDATIVKTNFGIDIHTDVPEPGTAVLAFVALCGLGVGGSRKR